MFFELDDLLGPGPHLPGPIGHSRTMPVNSPEINRFPETQLQVPPEVEENDGDIVFTQYNPEYAPNIHLHPILQLGFSYIFVSRRKTTFRRCKANFRFLQRVSPTRTQLETFAMGIRHSRSEEAQQSPSIYIHSQLQDICETWDILLKYSKSLLSTII